MKAIHEYGLHLNWIRINSLSTIFQFIKVTEYNTLTLLHSEYEYSYEYKLIDYNYILKQCCP